MFTGVKFEYFAEATLQLSTEIDARLSLAQSKRHS